MASSHAELEGQPDLGTRFLLGWRKGLSCKHYKTARCAWVEARSCAWAKAKRNIFLATLQKQRTQIRTCEQQKLSKGTQFTAEHKASNIEKLGNINAGIMRKCAALRKASDSHPSVRQCRHRSAQAQAVPGEQAGLRKAVGGQEAGKPSCTVCLEDLCVLKPPVDSPIGVQKRDFKAGMHARCAALQLHCKTVSLAVFLAPWHLAPARQV